MSATTTVEPTPVNTAPTTITAPTVTQPVTIIVPTLPPPLVLSTVTVGQGAIKTVQQAVDLVVDGGTVYLEGKTYVENVVATKNVKFVGVTGTQIKAADNTKPVVRLSGSGGTIENVTLQGGMFGVLATGLNKSVVVRNSRISGAMCTGIEAQLVRLTVENSQIENALVHGINAYLPAAVSVKYSSVFGCGGTGLYVYGLTDNNGMQKTITLDHSTFTWNEKPGVYVEGNLHHVIATGCQFTSNGAAGMMLRDISDSRITDCTFSFSRALANKLWGDGLVIWNAIYNICTNPAWVSITGCQFNMNARCAITIKDAKVTVSNVVFVLNPIEMNGEGDFDARAIGPYTIVPLPGNSTILHVVTSVIQLPNICASAGGVDFGT